MIQMAGVSKTYNNGVPALTDIDLNIDKGEFVFVIGPSGAGKSTLVRLLFLEELPTSGQIYISGRSILRLNRKEIARLRRNFGVVFQDFRLLPNLSVYDNVAFALRVTECSKNRIRQRVPEVLELVGLSHKKDVLPTQLSGGEQQRVAVARAIVNQPMVLIADEPTGNLDPKTSWELMELFEKISQTGTTILVATHAKEIVDKMKKRVLVLDQGTLIRDDVEGGYHEVKNDRLLL
ncbi:cell division ATP-binding protein FtsE [Dehalobacterium formicoaceticum]|uniref:Cell division ATP-binding protein FtsE n=1 Tax=Dehalobacterium formicoaceticum TaxID=51515 RepID=A0ABT1Y3D0_9FIRM|nr:cell division ATP-binding protein FtsE [Dehalobacterium formicoaceticum]MCR6545377.1 cell division ATP-binding protein FtsE [Dehalobacterium formicoaceticum]